MRRLRRKFISTLYSIFLSGLCYHQDSETAEMLTAVNCASTKGRVVEVWRASGVTRSNGPPSSGGGSFEDHSPLGPPTDPLPIFISAFLTRPSSPSLIGLLSNAHQLLKFSVFLDAKRHLFCSSPSFVCLCLIFSPQRSRTSQGVRLSGSVLARGR